MTTRIRLFRNGFKKPLVANSYKLVTNKSSICLPKAIVYQGKNDVIFLLQAALSFEKQSRSELHETT
jgi:hypothetical protein